VGFDAFAQFNYATADKMNQQLAEWVDDIRDSEPFFVYLHYMDAHGPYHAHEGVEVPPVPLPYPEFATDPAHPVPEKVREEALLRFGARDSEDPVASERAMREWMEARLHDYVSEVQYLDAKIAEALEMIGVDDDTLVIVVADHGEEFGDHGNVRHQFQLYPELLRVPFIIRWPSGGIRPGRVAAPVSALSIYPTFRDLLGERPSQVMAERSLKGVMAGAPLESRPLFAMRQRAWEDAIEELVAVIEGPHLLIQRGGKGAEAGKTELYDVVRDPGARTDLSTARPDVVDNLREQWLRFVSTARRHEPEFSLPFEMDDEVADHLQELGYVGGN